MLNTIRNLFACVLTLCIGIAGYYSLKLTYQLTQLLWLGGTNKKQFFLDLGFWALIVIIIIMIVSIGRIVERRLEIKSQITDEVNEDGVE